MNENILKRILQEISDEEISEYCRQLSFKTSLRHRLAMKRIFARFEKNARRVPAVPAPCPDLPVTHVRSARKLIVLFAIIACAVLLTGFMAVCRLFASNNFRGDIFSDHTKLWVFNAESCPAAIEHIYYLSELPEGFEMVDYCRTLTSVSTRYENKPSEKGITFSQYAKSSFTAHYNTEHHDIEEIDINGQSGLCIDFSDDRHNYSLIAWDHGDYILEIVGDLDKNYAINLAKSAEILKN